MAWYVTSKKLWYHTHNEFSFSNLNTHFHFWNIKTVYLSLFIITWLAYWCTRCKGRMKVCYYKPKRRMKSDLCFHLCCLSFVLFVSALCFLFYIKQLLTCINKMNGNDLGKIRHICLWDIHLYKSTAIYSHCSFMNLISTISFLIQVLLQSWEVDVNIWSWFVRHHLRDTTR